MSPSDRSDNVEALHGARIALGISGGIAAYKAPLLIRLLKKAGADVRVLTTQSALKFTTRWTLETLSGNQLETEVFPESRSAGTHHVSAAEWADLFVVAPVTANLIGKIAAGISDDVLTTTLCAYSGPVMLAPAMNTNMYLNPVTRKT
ncbi:MAG: flavoprotein [Candidatus Zixiibacteriota bacterium]